MMRIRLSEDMIIIRDFKRFKYVLDLCCNFWTTTHSKMKTFLTVVDDVTRIGLADDGVRLKRSKYVVNLCCNFWITTHSQLEPFLTGADDVMRIGLSDDGIKSEEIQICSGSLLQSLKRYS